MVTPVPRSRCAIRRLLHPSDLSTWSEPAFAEALRWAKADRAELLLLYVVAPWAPIIGDEYVSSPLLFSELNRALWDGARESLGGLLARATEVGVCGESMLMQGLPADQIVHAAETRDVDLIVMGTHGRTGLPRLIHGSTAQDVVAKAPCPVLLVGPQAGKREFARRHLTAFRRRPASREADDAPNDPGVGSYGGVKKA